MLATLAGLVLAALGPFGNYLNGPFPWRLAYWLVASWIGIAIYGGMFVLISPWRRAGLAGWLLLAGGVLAASVPEGWLTYQIAVRFWPVLRDSPPALWYGQTVLIGAALTLAMAWPKLSRAAAVKPGAMPNEQAPPGADLGALIDDSVLALQMEDHYVRIHQRGGSRMVLMPLREAIQAAGRIDGLQTHRSWWVARSAVSHVAGSPRAMRLKLTNGLEVPVARTAVARLREAGWIGGS